jgi:hypothetical protein
VAGAGLDGRVVLPNYPGAAQRRGVQDSYFAFSLYSEQL